MFDACVYPHFRHIVQQRLFVEERDFPVNQPSDGTVQRPFEHNDDAGGKNNGIVVFVAGHAMPVQGAEEQPRKYVQREDSQKRITYPLVCTELQLARHSAQHHPDNRRKHQPVPAGHIAEVTCQPEGGQGNQQVGPEYQKIPAECRGHKLVYWVGKRNLPYEPGNVPYLTKPSITEQTVSISSSVM